MKAGDLVIRVRDGANGYVKGDHGVDPDHVWVVWDCDSPMESVHVSELKLAEAKMLIELVAITPDAELVIEEAGRTCYMSHDRTKEGSAAVMIRGLIKRGHFSVLEHASATFNISGVSRATTHQLVRHRIASYSQASQRYVRVRSMSPVIPPAIHSNPEAMKVFMDCIDTCKDAYDALLKLGVMEEDARYLLPNATPSTIVVTMNFRELRTAMGLRLEKHAQWEIRQMFAGMLGILKTKASVVFEDLELDEYNCLKEKA